MKPEQQKRINDLCAQTYAQDAERQRVLDPILRGRRFAALSDAEGAEVIAALTALRDGEPADRERTEERYGLYIFSPARRLERLATGPDPGSIGAALVTLDEDEREARGPQASLGDRGRIGVRDRLQRRWIVNPFPPSVTV